MTVPNTASSLEDNLATGRRESQRARLHLAATLVTTTRDIPVTLRNLSRAGAMVEGHGLPAAGRLVTLKRGAIDVMAEIVWSRDGRCGLDFDETLSHDEIVAQTRCPPEIGPPGTIGGIPASGYRPTGLEGDRLSADEWHRAKAIATRHQR